MTKPVILQTLNRLLTIVYRSLPMYLTYASPWTRHGDERAVAALRHIVEDQKQLSTRIAQYILQHHGSLETGEYPIEFLDMHDLSLDFLLTRLVEHQRSEVAALERCVRDLQADREATALAEEALGSVRGHLETLEELAGELTRSSPAG